MRPADVVAFAVTQVSPVARLVLPLAILAAVTDHARGDEENGLRCSVAPAADANGDGHADVAVAGRTRALGIVDLELPSVVWILSSRDLSLIRTIRPPRKCSDFGRALQDAGDCDGDGATDLVVAGGDRVWIFSGKDGEALHELDDGLAGPGFGHTLAGGADLDGDGHADVAVYRALDEDRIGRAGILGLYSGKTGSLLRVIVGARENVRGVTGRDICLRIDGRIAGALDLVHDRDDDGRAELALVTARGEETWLDVIDPWTASSRFSKTLPIVGPGRPWIVADVGDANGDGVSDLAVSIVHERLVVCSGTNGEELRRHESRSGSLIADGTSLDVLGDIDGDGTTDLLWAANEDSLDCEAGYVVALGGPDLGILHTMKIADPNARVPRGIGEPCRIGADACAIPDVDGDGVRDVAVHLPRAPSVHVLSGATFEEIVRVETSVFLSPESEQGR